MLIRGSIAGIGLGLVLALTASLAPAAKETAQTPGMPRAPLPDNWELAPGQPLILNGVEYALRVSPRSAATELDIDLLVRPVLTRSRRPAAGRYVPHVDARFMLGLRDGSSTQGRLAFRLSPAGASYGRTLRLDAPPNAALSLSLNVKHGHERWSFTYRIPAAAWRAVPPPRPPGSSIVGESQDGRLRLLGTLDPRPDETYSDIWGYTDRSVHLAIMGVFSGTVFIDVTNPLQPVEIGFIPGPLSSWRDIKTYRQHAYIVTEGIGAGEGMQIVDLSDPLAPQLVGTYTDTFFTAHNIFIDEATGFAWCVGTNDGMRVLNLAGAPDNIVEVGSWSERYVHDIFVRDGVAQLSEFNDGIHETAFVGDPNNLRVQGTFATPGERSHNSWPNPSNSILATSDELPGGHLALFDITNLSGPFPLLGEYQPVPAAIVHNVFFDDDDAKRIAVSHYTAGTHLVDIHRPAHPFQLGVYDVSTDLDGSFNGVWGVYPFDARGYFYASDIDVGLQVLAYEPTGGMLSGIVRDATDGTPVFGANLQFFPDGEEQATAEDGVYVTYIDTAESLVRIHAPGYRTAVSPIPPVPFDGRLDLDFELEPLPRATLRGRVLHEDDGTPVVGAEVTLPGTLLSATSDEDGRFALDNVGVGQRVLIAQAQGFTPNEARVIVAAGEPGAEVNIALSPARYFDNFESATGWIAGVASDTATSGIWTRVDPVGTGGGLVQPEFDNTPAPGSLAFITGQSAFGATTEDNDVEGGVTTLLSPVFNIDDLPAVRLSYHRWVSNNSSVASGGALRVEASTNGGLNWETLELVDDNANTWVRRDVALDTLLPLDSTLRLRFRAEASVGFDSFKVLECGIDDVTISADCLHRFSPQRADNDGDGTVDACDSCPFDGGNDIDGDGFCGDVDNAPLVTNPEQLDADGDRIGDATDNCVDVANIDQLDQDRDGLGNACDDDLDGDGVPNLEDPDQDGDGQLDANDNCPLAANAAQRDGDGDGIGDSCDLDDDQIAGLRLDRDSLHWTPELTSDSYNVYRGALGHPALVALASCEASGVGAPYHVDRDLPQPGDGFLYLVAAVREGVQGSLGVDSVGIPRSIVASCDP